VDLLQAAIVIDKDTVVKVSRLARIAVSDAEIVTEGNQADRILANAPVREGPFFAVPTVVE
jgi:Asp-tRNA(Asn)/Glu-tRNA(Gln) amidotransferase C subunit